ncbi:MAG: AraC family transcriptional regulator [Bacteroidales bacterium]
MADHKHFDNVCFHFNFLRNIKVHGFYYDSFDSFLSSYPFIRKDHYHNFYSVLFFQEGNGTLRLDNDTFPVRPQTACLIAPNQLHSFEGLKDARGLVFFFCEDFYVEEFSFVRLLNIFSCTSRTATSHGSPCIELNHLENGFITDIVKSICQEYENYSSSDNSSIIIRSLLNVMLLRLSQLNDEKSGIPVNGKGALIHDLSRLIDRHFTLEHNISFYSSAFNVSERQLNELCNRHFRCGLKKILTDRLMQEARKLLTYSELSVSEISYKLNFDDNSYFNKVFRKQTGLTPKRFRDIHKKLVP